MGPARLRTEHRPDAQHACGQLLDPAQPGRRLEGVLHARPRLLGQLRRALEIVGRYGVLKRFGRITIGLIPVAGTPVIIPHVRSRLLQPLAQQIRKQPVIAVPLPIVIQRDDEQVRAFEVFQDGVRMCECDEWRICDSLPSLIR